MFIIFYLKKKTRNQVVKKIRKSKIRSFSTLDLTISHEIKKNLWPKKRTILFLSSFLIFSNAWSSLFPHTFLFLIKKKDDVEKRFLLFYGDVTPTAHPTHEKNIMAKKSVSSFVESCDYERYFG